MRGSARQDSRGARQPQDMRAVRRSGRAKLRARDGGRGARPGSGILSLQRARLLGAALGVIAEHGYDAAPVSMICERAGVSRRTYYEVFENREECLAAILLDAEARVTAELADAGLDDRGWLERVRGGLGRMLLLAEAEPALARVCLLETQRASGPVAVERERILARIVALLEQGRHQSAHGSAAGALTAEALVGAITAVVAARLTSVRAIGIGESGRAPRELLGELMSMIALLYLGPAAAHRELRRPLPPRPEPLRKQRAEGMSGSEPDPLAGLPMRLTYRTARVLHAVAALEGPEHGPSNRQIATHAGVADQGQISKLLSRLERNRLLVNAAKGSEGKGEANSWSLTEIGRRLLHDIGAAPAIELNGNGGRGEERAVTATGRAGRVLEGLRASAPRSTASPTGARREAS